jgi:hypothetical protein
LIIVSCRFFYDKYGNFPGKSYELRDVAGDNSDVIKFNFKEKYIECICNEHSYYYISLENYEKIKEKYDDFLKEIGIIARYLLN